jgi:MFS family permease
LLLALLFVETQVDGPILDLRLFVNGPFSAGLAMSCLAFVVLGATSFTMPFFLQLGLGLPIAQVGLLMAISPVIGGVTAPVGGTLSDRFGPRWVSVVGLALMCAGSFLLASMDETTSLWRFALSVAPVGLGMGLFSSANNSGVLNAVPRERLGIASGLLSLARTLGQSTGVPIAASLFSAFALGYAAAANHRALLSLPPASLVHGTRWAYAAAGIAALAGTCIAVWMLVRERAARGRPA